MNKPEMMLEKADRMNAANARINGGKKGKEHTPGPWSVAGNGWIGTEAEGYLPIWTPFIANAHADKYGGANAVAKANAERIVACVNACEGIPTSALERHGAGMGGHMRTNGELCAEVQSLREALQALAKVYGPLSSSMKIGSERRMLWDAAFKALGSRP